MTTALYVFSTVSGAMTIISTPGFTLFGVVYLIMAGICALHTYLFRAYINKYRETYNITNEYAVDPL